MAGRPQHDFWKKIDFEQVKINGKNASLCNYCNKILKNTAKKRLLGHRNVCKEIIARNKTNRQAENVSAILSDSDDTASEDENEDEIPLAKIARLESRPIENRKVGFLDGDEKVEDDQNPPKPEPVISESFGPSPGPSSTPSPSCSTLGSWLNQPSGPSSFSGDSTSLITTNNYLNLQENPELHKVHDKVIVKSGRKETSKISSKKQSNTGLPRPRMPNDLMGFCDKISIKEQEKVNLALCEFIFGCNIPFSVVESDHFKKFIDLLRPSYKLPTRKTLSTSLLTKCYENCKKSIKNFDKESVMLIDGWKNSSNNTKNVVCLIHNVDGDIAFLESFDLTGEKETGDKLQEIVERCVAIAREVYNTDIYAVCSDNASNMKKMGAQINLWYTNCNSHTANLLAKELVSENIAGKVQSVLKEFSSPDLENDLLKLGGKRVMLAGETRWCSYRDAFVNFLENLKPMRSIIAEATSFKANITKLVFDENLKKQIEDSVKLFDPVCKLINLLQSTQASIADAAEEWIKLELPEGFDEYNQCLKKRQRYALNIFSLAANFLHPVYRGKLFTDDQIRDVDEFFLDNLDAEGLDGLQDFKNNRNIFQKLTDKKITKVRTFWELAQKHCPTLSRLAIKLNTIPASSAQLERLFSNWSYVHSSIRNRLTSENSKKLTYIYYQLKIKDSNKTDEY